MGRGGVGWVVALPEMEHLQVVDGLSARLLVGFVGGGEHLSESTLLLEVPRVAARRQHYIVIVHVVAIVPKEWLRVGDRLEVIQRRVEQILSIRLRLIKSLLR